MEGHQADQVSPLGSFPNTAWNRGEVYAGDRHLATYTGTGGTTVFDHADWLGTERARTDITGAVCETISSLPFGDGQSVSDSCGDSNGDVSPLHFTGKERDTESNLDNFGARYYSSQLGRFMSPDWSPSLDPDPVPYADLRNPQSLNLYNYTKNNPITATDPNGHCDIDGEHHDWAWCLAHALGFAQTLKEEADQARNDLNALRNTTINGQAPQDFAKTATNQQLVAADRALAEIVAQDMTDSLSRACPQQGASCGVVLPFDFAVEGETVNWSATFSSEGEARAFARTKLGSDAIEVEPGKWRSKNGKWQYRAKEGDLNDPSGPHIHLEELDPNTGQVIQNVHLRWPEGTGR